MLPPLWANLLDAFATILRAVVIKRHLARFSQMLHVKTWEQTIQFRHEVMPVVAASDAPEPVAPDLERAGNVVCLPGVSLAMVRGKARNRRPR